MVFFQWIGRQLGVFVLWLLRSIGGLIAELFREMGRSPVGAAVLPSTG